MDTYAQKVMLSLMLLNTCLATGCRAQEAKSSQAAPPAAVQSASIAAQTDLFVKNENLQPVYFDSGKSQLDPSGMNALKTNVDWLKKNLPMQIEVAGYSDGRGTPEQNLAVGQRRAAALRDFYVSMGIPRSRISTVTLGQEEPVCYEQTDDCQAKNRRVETLIENKSLASR